jgi:hypothetical protein
LHPKLHNPLTIKSVSLEERGLRNIDGVAEIAASTNARLVADFDPGIFIIALIGLGAAPVKPPRKGALQFVISTILPTPIFLRLGF